MNNTYKPQHKPSLGGLWHQSWIWMPLEVFHTKDGSWALNMVEEGKQVPWDIIESSWAQEP
jgi:hypothetical protein